jgi:hypothetical protein
VTVVAVLAALAIGLLAGYALGSSGPCDHDALDAEESTTARLLHEAYEREDGCHRG